MKFEVCAPAHRLWRAKARRSFVTSMRYSLLRPPISFTAFLAIAVAVAGCASSADYDPKVRRERMLAIYPPGETTRGDVQKKWAPLTPEFTAVRPFDGWESLDKARVRERVASSEQRTGAQCAARRLLRGP